jgi:hypothetical protein
MHSNYLVVLALLSSYVNGLPLNINLGAYSPALVVGDGEISFGGKADVSNLMNALEGAAVAGGAANGAAAAPAAAAVAQPQQANGAIATQAAPVDQSTQITALQGMGKEIAPRVVPLVKIPTEKRDIAGFTAALNYATGALTKSPEIELGTGEGGSGVGITQKPGGVTTGAKAAAIAAREIVAREEVASPKMRTTVTTMFVRGGPAPAQLGKLPHHSQSYKHWLTFLTERSAEDSTPLEKRAPSPVPSPSQGLDGVNLNMAEGQVAELTFVETRAVNGAEDNE